MFANHALVVLAISGSNAWIELDWYLILAVGGATLIVPNHTEPPAVDSLWYRSSKRLGSKHAKKGLRLSDLSGLRLRGLEFPEYVTVKGFAGVQGFRLSQQVLV